MRAQVVVLAMKQLERSARLGRLPARAPEDFRDDGLVHELIELLQLQPPPGLIADEASAKYKERVLERIGQLTLEVW